MGSPTFHLALAQELVKVEESYEARVFALHPLRRSPTPFGEHHSGSKPLDEYLLEMKQALRRAGEDDPAWMKFHLTSGLKDLSIRKAMLF